jgi:ADP-ribose pyrophosphatase YjhB (NUDIX family)
MNFCSHCGAAVHLEIPAGDNRQRFVCATCKTIHYENPKMVIGAIPVWEDRVLLCKRAIEPRLGYWTLPAGFMENGESTAEAAARETLEEANARVELMDLYTMYTVTHVNQVHLFYRATLLDLDFGPGTESLEVRLFREDEIDWKELAFRTVSTTLSHFFSDRRDGRFRFHSGALAPVR